MSLFLREKPLLSAEDEERFIQRMRIVENRRRESVLHLENVILEVAASVEENVSTNNPFQLVKQMSEVAKERERFKELSKR
ncbi:hypothetical protein [Peribacillus tepidiphilus]|jgi:hypothetical protein|uniref:hypothetical protein n=1 Tax=Peribacillus tepidiphilus TaxID=2652445 RepID=UPI0012918442|nr:hypothetical protein [Peribacillus tepidiphilus]